MVTTITDPTDPRLSDTLIYHYIPPDKRDRLVKFIGLIDETYSLVSVCLRAEFRVVSTEFLNQTDTNLEVTRREEDILVRHEDKFGDEVVVSFEPLALLHAQSLDTERDATPDLTLTGLTVNGSEEFAKRVEIVGNRDQSRYLLNTNGFEQITVETPEPPESDEDDLEGIDMIPGFFHDTQSQPSSPSSQRSCAPQLVSYDQHVSLEHQLSNLSDLEIGHDNLFCDQPLPDFDSEDWNPTVKNSATILSAMRLIDSKFDTDHYPFEVFVALNLWSHRSKESVLVPWSPEEFLNWMRNNPKLFRDSKLVDIDSSKLSSNLVKLLSSPSFETFVTLFDEGFYCFVSEGVDKADVTLKTVTDWCRNHVPNFDAM
ncbi:hypothetical protein JCM5350_000813 [Sporobolomyces pararoseus]